MPLRFAAPSHGSQDFKDNCGHMLEETSFIPLRKMEIDGKPRNVSIRLLKTRERLRSACDLVNDRYAWRGYGSDHEIPRDATHMTFTAEIDGEVAGTITLAIDSTTGLAADRCFREELDHFRARPGARLCELIKFAFGSGVRSKEIMAALFHIVFVYGKNTFDCTDLFIEVNPRHVRFYEALLGFERIGALKMNDSVSAPSQLMGLKVAKIREQIDLSASGAVRPSAHSLYPFFFSPRDEHGIFQRLTQAPRHSAQIAPSGKRSEMPIARPARPASARMHAMTG